MKSLPRCARIFALLLCLLASAALRAESPCSVVYGENWALLLVTPNGWEANCSGPSDRVLALWPHGTSFALAPGSIYVTVSNKDGLSLKQFAENALARTKEQSPNLQVQPMAAITLPNKHQALIRKISGDQDGSHELIAYADAGNVYLTLVLNAQTPQSFSSFNAVFRGFVSSIHPMEMKFAKIN